jgi:hypothetical protein
MNHENLLQRAIQYARIGDRSRARDTFLEVIDLDPDNLIALAWLIDLLDDLEDRIYACQKVVDSNPENPKIQARLNELLSLRPTNQEIAISESINQLVQAEHLLAEGKRNEAGKLLLSFVKTEKQNQRAWLLLSEVIDDEAKQIAALKNVLQINPANEQARIRLEELQHFRENPLDRAAKYEEDGKYEEALAAYQRAALVINYGPQFDKIYKNIERLEKHKESGVVYVRPDQSIARLTFGPPLLFFLLMLIHNQMNPFAFTPDLWVGVVLTFGGGFLLAVADVRSRHAIWVKLFDDPGGGGSPLARVTLSLAGWLLLFISFTYLFQISFERLSIVATNTFLP